MCFFLFINSLMLSLQLFIFCPYQHYLKKKTASIFGYKKRFFTGFDIHKSIKISPIPILFSALIPVLVFANQTVYHLFF